MEDGGGLRELYAGCLLDVRMGEVDEEEEEYQDEEKEWNEDEENGKKN